MISTALTSERSSATNRLWLVAKAADEGTWQMAGAQRLAAQEGSGSLLEYADGVHGSSGAGQQTPAGSALEPSGAVSCEQTPQHSAGLLPGQTSPPAAAGAQRQHQSQHTELDPQLCLSVL